MEFKSSTGKKVVINPADFGDVIDLKSAIAKELSRTDIDIDIDASKGMDQDINIMDFAKLFLAVDSSKEVYNCLFSCLARCTYDGERITESTFEDLEAREDYYQIATECLKVNLSPFIKGLISRLNVIEWPPRDQAQE